MGGWVFCRDRWTDQRGDHKEIHPPTKGEAIAGLCHRDETPAFRPESFRLEDFLSE